jgi:hypothetical protein
MDNNLKHVRFVDVIFWVLTPCRCVDRDTIVVEEHTASTFSLEDGDSMLL